MPQSAEASSRSVLGSGTRARIVTSPSLKPKSPFAEASGVPPSVKNAFDSVNGETPGASAWKVTSTRLPLGVRPGQR